MDLATSVQYVKGVGERVGQLLARLGITTVEDLIYHFPRRYEDYSNVVKIKDIKPGPLTLKVKVKSVHARYARRGLHITEALVSDNSGTLKIIWFNQPYRAAALKNDKDYFVAGEYSYQGDRYQIVNPSMELVSTFPKNTARIVPVYPETKGLKSHQIRKFISELAPLIKDLPESLPDFVVTSEKLMSRAEALWQLHFPASNKTLDKARSRLGFEELYEVILASLLNKQAAEQSRGTPIKFQEALAKRFVASLPFALTDDQRRSAWQILQDLAKPRPMNRLLEGDVGSGKSVVAAMAILQAATAGAQTAYMAPTEILARQQHETIGQLLQPFGVKTELFIGALAAAEKRNADRQIKSGEVDLVIGTHALIEKHPTFKNLALVVVDEQHRFGVNQREKLMGKAKEVPHVLSMSATPIPRSLALTVFGELDISIIDELPPGRLPVKTEVVSPASRAQLYRKVEAELEHGRQAYVICPLIDDSDVLGVKSVTAEYKRLKEGPFKQFKIGLLHGQLMPDQKTEVMQKFNDGELDILVSTSVVEVGVNVPNATLMIIEGAERFGLAQLHQLRGRVRRSTHQSYAFLIPSTSDAPLKRLRVVAANSDGFALAELDLKLRGPGEMYGHRQHGALDLRLAKLSDARLIARARLAAGQTIKQKINLLNYPRLSARVADLRKITNLN